MTDERRATNSDLIIGLLKDIVYNWFALKLLFMKTLLIICEMLLSVEKIIHNRKMKIQDA